MVELLFDTILQQSATAAVDVLARAVERKNEDLIAKKNTTSAPKPQFISTTSVTKKSLIAHIEEIKRWCTGIRFSDLKGEKSVARVYVALDTYLIPMRLHQSQGERAVVAPLLQTLINARSHCAILGSAGAGKTTSLQKVCVDYFSNGKILLNQTFPLLVRLRDLPSSGTISPIYDQLQEILALRIDFPMADLGVPPESAPGISRRVLNAYLDELGAAVLLDGFDEIASTVTRQAVLSDLKSLGKGLAKTKILLTSRSSDFKYNLEGFESFEIASLTKSQISAFAHRWLPDPVQAQDFLQKIDRSPFADTTVRPLTVAHLCAIYERIKDIPDKPKSVYRRIVHLLLEEWDTQRDIKRSTKYSGFDVDRKLEFLAQLAYELTTSDRTLLFTPETLKRIYDRICLEHGLPHKDSAAVVEELESHTGLILESGYRTYEFAHKSLQEFLTADYIVRLPSLLGVKEHLRFLANEVAIATALSSKPGVYLCELILRTLENVRLSRDWYTIYASRLVLEKPDLRIGEPTDSAIAIFHLLSCVNNYEMYAEAFRSMLPSDPLEHLSAYYVVKPSNTSYLTLERRASHKALPIPEVLKVPRWPRV